MSHSEIVVPTSTSKEKSSFTVQQQKLRQAYLYERQNLALLEIELNRSKVVVMDEHGRFLRLVFVLEH
ncbi:hypothetical protein EXA23_02360 [Vibrio cincinnatiensis]|jgi:hypothetical protein|uniref:Uncharacterized protein n=1 Tax=Vibrio cincinnatiensis DSM 19608 TaxID=1123491 RepID=A0A1T4S142_VIBCI|nr:hypothetical protein [Vibrio cincinnatiensis]MCG3723157.1 hypothetical protein [Vibrio cincinnatiensis]MCG3726185.1 hypothetical protein [Vibrio cincinnatiensis]MCG3733778.1 hypothetical protein [Vibrio cincinnatiensis]MCG3736662.1 hypothetical protein [Vibrio cincinnatiensis]MCG3740962.1 hypothetical protein [Vibrio cincinnatiensis]